MEGCIYCGRPIENPSPEHIIPRSLGAHGFVIDVCLDCNRRANRWVDAPLVQCTSVRRARADLGMVDERGRPHEVHFTGNVVATVAVDEDRLIDNDLDETFTTGAPVDKPGLMAHLSWNGTDFASEMMESGRSIDDQGRNVHDIYVHDDDEPDDTVYDPDFEPEHFMAVVKASRPCPHDPAAWQRFAAKTGLGLLGALGTGRIAGASLDDIAAADNHALAVAGLRAVAMPDSPPARSPRGCAPTGFDGPSQPAHQVATIAVDGDVVFRVLLFGILDLRSRIEGVEFHHDIEIEVPVRVGSPAA